MVFLKECEVVTVCVSINVRKILRQLKFFSDICMRVIFFVQFHA